MSIFFTPLVLIIIILLIGLVLRFRNYLLSPKLSRTALLVYCAILIISALSVYLLPTENLRQQHNLEQDLYTQANNNMVNFLEIAKQGKLDSTPGVYKNAGYRYQVADDRLVLAPDDGLPCEILIHRGLTDEKIIEISSYVTSHIIQNTDITEQILPPVFSLSGNTLRISPPDRYTLEYISFKKDFTSLQFSASPNADPLRNSTVFGRQAIYLSVPKSLRIEAGQHTVVYLNSNS